MTKPKKGRPSIEGVTVYPRGKRFAFNVDLRPDLLTGERKREYRGGFTTADEAWTEAMKVKAAVDENRNVSRSRRSVADYFTEWLTAVEHSLKPSTHTNYSDYSMAYVIPIIGKRRLQDIDVPTLNALYRRLLESGRIKPDNNSKMYAYWSSRVAKGHEPHPLEIARACETTIYAARSAVARYRRGRVPVIQSPGLEPKTVRNIHRMIHRALSDAVAWRYLSYNPAAHASLPRTPRGKKSRPKPWTVEELGKWLKLAGRDRDAGIWVLAATTGMRRSELAGARREQLDMETGLLTIEATRIVVAGRAQDSDGKTDSSVRTISLDSFTIAALRAHIARLDDEARAFGAGYEDHGLLLCKPDGRPIHPDTITRRFNRLVDAASVPLIRLHDVRHTYATVALDAGINPKQVSDRIGHSNVGFTLATYGHRSTGEDGISAQVFADLIFGLAAPESGSGGPLATDVATEHPTQ